jgi:membrane-bound lytic murein transglycosylase MltF
LPGLFRVKHVSHREIQRGYQAADPKKAALLRRIRETACRFGVDPAIGQGVAWTESRFDPSARSPDGLSSGAFQLTAVTAAQMRSRLRAANKELPLHDEVTLGVGYLRYLAGLFEKRTVLYRDGLTTVGVTDPVECWRFAIAAYNAGEGRVAAAQHRAASLGRNPARFDDVRPLLPPITRRYVDNVISFGVSQGAEKVQVQATAREAGNEALAS